MSKISCVTPAEIAKSDYDCTSQHVSNEAHNLETRLAKFTGQKKKLEK